VDENMMYLSLKIMQQKDQTCGIIEIHKRKTITCTEKIGVISFASEEEKRFLIDLLTKGGIAGDIIEKPCGQSRELQ
jgi:hypothetical protein